MTGKPVIAAALVGILVALAGCQHFSTPKQRTEALTLSSASLSRRNAQSRRFQTKDESEVLSACAALLQDLGFSIDESSMETGLLSASKDRKSNEWSPGGHGLMFLNLIGSLGGENTQTYGGKQKIRVSIVTKPVPGNSILVRVTFQRALWSSGAATKVETVDDMKIYQEFFDKLSQSIFLEAHKI